ncbi:hypothetical protein [Actinophytocola sp. KF-1]
MSEHLTRAVVWRRTGAPVFVHAARVDGAWWVLRRNSFPDHPLFTLFVAGRVAGDVNDVRARAPAWDLEVGGRPAVTEEERAELLAPLRGLGPYGSEVGRPCDGDWCSCTESTVE